MATKQSGKRDAAALAFAAGQNAKVIAKKQKIGLRTLYYWCAEPEFQQLIRELRNKMIEATIGRLARRGSKASGTVGKLLDSKNEKIRLGAAKIILDNLLKVRADDVVEEVEALKVHLAEIEKMIAGASGDQETPVVIPDAEESGSDGEGEQEAAGGPGDESGGAGPQPAEESTQSQAGRGLLGDCDSSS